MIAGTLASATTARAADGKAEELINQAVSLRRSGDDQAAYGLLQQAYDLSHSPRAAGQRGLCEQALGRWADAELHITEALKATGDPWVKKSRHALEQSLLACKAHIARIEVSGEPTGAEVLVNGSLVGHLPMTAPARVGAGEVEIELRAPGYTRVSRGMHVEGGQYQKIVLRAQAERVLSTPAPVAVGTGSTPAPAPKPTAVPAPAAAPPATPAPASAPPAVASATPSTPETSATVSQASGPPSPAPGPLASTPQGDESSHSGSLRGAAKWVSWGLGAAALGVGIFGYSRQHSAGQDFDSSCGVDMNGVVHMQPGSSQTDAGCMALQSRVDSGYRLELAGFIAAGALGVVGLVFWLTEPKPMETKVGLLSCLPGFTLEAGPWMGCRFQF